MASTHELKLWRLHLIYARDGRRCHWCRRELLAIDDIPQITSGPLPDNYPTIDHLHPQSLRGGNTPSNLVAACTICNNARGAQIHPPIPRPSTIDLLFTVPCPDCEPGLLCDTCDDTGRATPARLAERVRQLKQLINIELETLR